MPEAQLTSYDVVPYESYPYAQTHPDRLATVAALLGLKPAPVGRCRVLELGCAAGGNLLPMAVALPESRFLGIDLSARQVAEGQATLEALGLTNVELWHLSILDVDDRMGEFDYVICHGVYSWVPSPVQEKILDVCQRSLAPNGVAYISYNTYPGWHMRGMIRDMMAYHARQFVEPAVRIQQARNLLDFMARSVSQENSPFSLLLKSEVEAIRQSRDAYLFHEHLEECNEPVYFYQFAERASAHGLRFLGEVELAAMVPGNNPPEVESVLRMLAPDLLHMEQYMDFLRNRMFRQTLLCHRHHTPNYSLRPEQLRAFHVASPVKPVSDQSDIHSSAYLKFQGADGLTVDSCEPIVKAALLHLSELWPRSVPFDMLRAAARTRLSGESPLDDDALTRDTQVLGHNLLSFYASASTRLVELHVHPPHFVVEITERPEASALARLQALASDQVTSLRHEIVSLGEFERHLLRLLDGVRDRSAIVAGLAELVGKGILAVQQDGVAIQDAERTRELLSQAVDRQLPELARNALLVA